MPSLVPTPSKVYSKVKVNLLTWFKAIDISLPFEGYFPEIQRMIPWRCAYKSSALTDLSVQPGYRYCQAVISGMEGCHGGRIFHRLLKIISFNILFIDILLSSPNLKSHQLSSNYITKDFPLDPLTFHCIRGDEEYLQKSKKNLNTTNTFFQ